jgi:coenzyme F420-0:L-glutamate ligase/coenzyme F420-1:gamma-L-glutamate ligase
MDRGVLITETPHGFVCANAGVDASNAPADGYVTTLPKDLDASARALRDAFRRRTGADVAVIVSDSFGRPWREGSVNVALGVAGMSALTDLRGRTDDRGRVLRTTVVAVADELASAAQLVTGEMGGTPVAIVRGFAWSPSESGAGPLRRAPEKDLFR